MNVKLVIYGVFSLEVYFHKMLKQLFVFVLHFYANLCFDADDCQRLSQITNDNDDANYRFFSINTGDDIKNYENANRVCQLCLDGTLTTFNETKNLRDNILHWIGVRKLAGSADWRWSNGDKIENWKDYATKFKNQHVDHKSNYSAVAYKNGTMITWIATHDQAFKSNGRMASMMDNVSPTLFYSYIINNPLFVTCQRNFRDECHHWNFTDPQCIYDEKFGCHGYAWMMFHHADTNSSSKCSYHPNERFAFPCPESNCIRCRVSEWSDWSACSVKFCRDGVGVKKRHRKMLSSICPEDLYYISLKQTEECWVTGCDNLANQTFYNGN